MNEFDLNADNSGDINADKIIQYWLDMSENDYATMIDMFTIKRYSWSLFIGHLVIEKLLKALYVKTQGKHPPFLHDLLKLANKCNIEISEQQMDILDTITTFNINARYDDYKLAFFQKCTPEYTAIWINNIKQLRTWIKEML